MSLCSARDRAARRIVRGAQDCERGRALQVDENTVCAQQYAYLQSWLPLSRPRPHPHHRSRPRLRSSVSPSLSPSWLRILREEAGARPSISASAGSRNGCRVHRMSCILS